MRFCEYQLASKEKGFFGGGAYIEDLGNMEYEYIACQPLPSKDNEKQEEKYVFGYGTIRPSAAWIDLDGVRDELIEAHLNYNVRGSELAAEIVRRYGVDGCQGKSEIMSKEDVLAKMEELSKTREFEGTRWND